ncbi:APC family permease [Streptomyces sp. SAS_267]|uniref:APC family permease n=1 Tax=Streptomyces sp. SAS_267 TaxID=3412750 RepID=UPI00403CF6F1
MNRDGQGADAAEQGGGPYHPRTEHHQRRGRGRLRLRDASAMAIGGMIGGGIFSVLGVTIQLAGHLAFACFLLAGAVALVTAHSYAGLARRSGRSGGPYAYLCEAGHPHFAAITSWYLVFGYVLALAVYAFTFGHYVAQVFGTGDVVARIASVVVLGAFLMINVRGIGASRLTEDSVVLAKLVILAGIAGIGLFAWTPHRLSPLADTGYLGVFVGAASIFIAYEGFELLSYDYDAMEQPARTLPRALYLSVLVVIAVYVAVTLSSQMLVPDSLIVSQREVAFATVGQEALGTFGRWLATGAAVLATSSAINATLFSTARLVRDLSDARELPPFLGRTPAGVPANAMWMLALLGAVFAMLPGINELLAFASATFLGVFGLINYLHARTTDHARERVLGHLGATACAIAIIVLTTQLAVHEPTTLALIAGCVLGVGALRLVFARNRPSAPQ